MVAPALIGALVGAGYGALTYEDQKRQADEMRKANATIESTSPWTGVHGKVVGGPSLLGNVAGGALSGASFGMNDAFKAKAPAEAAGDAGGVATMATHPQAAMPSNYVEQASQNGQPQTYQQYGQPNAQGYSPWASMSGIPQQRPIYRPPGT